MKRSWLKLQRSFILSCFNCKTQLKELDLIYKFCVGSWANHFTVLKDHGAKTSAYFAF